MRHLLLSLLLGLSLSALADDVSIKLAKQLRVDPKDVVATKLPGLYRVTLGPQILYITADGQYALRGDLIQLKDGRNLSAEERAAARAAYVKGIPERDMIVFAPPHPRHVLTVLTDIDCGYCRQMAEETPQLVDLGVEVRYLPYPRSGVDSSSWQKAVAVWCAKDRRTSYQSAMQGNAIAGADACDQTVVAAGYDLAMKLGVHATPILITEGGQLIDGYIPAAQLAKLLDDPAALAEESL